METTAKRVMTVVLAGVLTMCHQGVATAESRLTADSPTMTVLILNHAGIPREVLAEAQAVASKIYAAVGVKIVWTEPSAVPRPSSAFRLTVTILAKAGLSGRSRSAAMGNAPGVNGSAAPAKRAYAFYDRIEEFARERGLGTATTVGCVMAHEIGHLLLGSHSHSRAGLMRALWGHEEVLAIAAGVLAFSESEAKALQLNAPAPLQRSSR